MGIGKGTPAVDQERRVDYDLYYIENWSLWLDVKIILRTLLGGWMGESAY